MYCLEDGAVYFSLTSSQKSYKGSYKWTDKRNNSPLSLYKATRDENYFHKLSQNF